MRKRLYSAVFLALPKVRGDVRGGEAVEDQGPRTAQALPEVLLEVRTRLSLHLAASVSTQRQLVFVASRSFAQHNTEYDNIDCNI